MRWEKLFEGLILDSSRIDENQSCQYASRPSDIGSSRFGGVEILMHY
jgi:hypothetical protein